MVPSHGRAIIFRSMYRVTLVGAQYKRHQHHCTYRGRASSIMVRLIKDCWAMTDGRRAGPTQTISRGRARPDPYLDGSTSRSFSNAR